MLDGMSEWRKRALEAEERERVLREALAGLLVHWNNRAEIMRQQRDGEAYLNLAGAAKQLEKLLATTPAPASSAAADEGTDTMLKVDGKSFRCSCGCNVFRCIQTQEPKHYRCNSCGTEFIGEGPVSSAAEAGEGGREREEEGTA